MNLLVKLLLLGHITLVSASKKDDFSEISSMHDSTMRNGTKRITYNIQREQSYTDMVKDRIFNDHITVMAS